MYVLKECGGQANYPYSVFICDTYDDLEEIIKNHKILAGSKAFVIDRSMTFILNGDGEWKSAGLGLC